MRQYTNAQLDAIDRLVAEHVMGWKPNTPCDYPQSDDWEVAELANSSDGWYCYKCGYVGGWGEADMGYRHDVAYPQYTHDKRAAMEVFEKCGTMMLAHASEDRYKASVITNTLDRPTAISNSLEIAICMAALAGARVEVPE